jgi:uncharacterized protein YecA (UPF0149 family)
MNSDNTSIVDSKPEIVEETIVAPVVETNTESVVEPIAFAAPVDLDDKGSSVCPLCGKENIKLSSRGKNLGCVNCLKNIVEPIINSIKLGRNDQCFCKSGKKFKKCCGKNQ